tara:strand:- start:370 stop:1242 length:873 start_codon:yes stop_codon:yes gene_type:complete
MSKGRSVSTTTQSVQIPDYLQNVQQEVFQAARDFQPEVFQGDRFAAVNPLEQAQLERLQQFGQDSGLIADTSGAVGNLLSGTIGQPTLLQQEFERDLSPEFLDQVIRDRIADQTDAITSQYSMAGRLGSDAFGSALGRGIGTAVAPLLADQQRFEADRRAQLAGQISDAERLAGALQLQGIGAVPSVQNLELQRIQGLGSAGELQRQMDTRSIVAEQARIAEENEAERQRLNALLQAAGAGEVGIGQVTTQQTPGGGIGSTLLGAGLLASGIADSGLVSAGIPFLTSIFD